MKSKDGWSETEGKEEQRNFALVDVDVGPDPIVCGAVLHVEDRHMKEEGGGGGGETGLQLLGVEPGSNMRV